MTSHVQLMSLPAFEIHMTSLVCLKCVMLLVLSKWFSNIFCIGLHTLAKDKRTINHRTPSAHTKELHQNSLIHVCKSQGVIAQLTHPFAMVNTKVIFLVPCKIIYQGMNLALALEQLQCLE